MILLVFLPPLLFVAAIETPIRELRTYVTPILRLAIGLVLFTMIIVAIVAQFVLPDIGWAAAFTLGAIVAPTDALAATSVFRRLGAPRLVSTLIEGEALFNDATALVAYRAGVLAVASGSFVLAVAIGGFVLAVVGGIGSACWSAGAPVRSCAGSTTRPSRWRSRSSYRSLPICPADQAGLSGVLAAVTAGLVIGSRLSRILTASSRVLWLSSWKMIGFVLNGFVFVLIGLELPQILEGVRTTHSPAVVDRDRAARVCRRGRSLDSFGCSRRACCPTLRDGSLRAPIHGLRKRLTFVVALGGTSRCGIARRRTGPPESFPERNLIVLITFAVILDHARRARPDPAAGDPLGGRGRERTRR